MSEPFEACYRVDDKGCWLWKRPLDKWGYGCKYYQGKVQKAHRVAWQLYRGPIPNELCVLHRCDVPRCVNPDHLFLGTNKDNMQDMVRKGRTKSQFSEVDVRQMKKMREEGVAYKRISLIFGAHPKAISHIVNGRRWSHLS